MSGKKQNMPPMLKTLTKHVDLDEPTSFFDHVHLGCTQRECKPNEIILERKREMFESRISAGEIEELPGWIKTCPTTWKGMLKSAWNDIANWRTKRQCNCTKSEPFVSNWKGRT